MRQDMDYDAEAGAKVLAAKIDGHKSRFDLEVVASSSSRKNSSLQSHDVIMTREVNLERGGCE